MDWIVTPTPEGIGTTSLLDAVSIPPVEASILEFRIDLFPDVDPSAVVGACPIPILATYRSAAEGGRGTDDRQRRRRTIERARDAGAALVDLEYERDLPLVADLGLGYEQLLVSWHDLDETPADLRERVRLMLGCPARWLKVVPTARSAEDVETIFTSVVEANPGAPGNRRVMVFGMGHHGVPTRYLGPVAGPPVMFCAWDDSSAVAPGQISATRLSRAVGHLHGLPRRLDLVLGGDVGASLSPSLHGAAYAQRNIPCALVPLSVDSPEAFLDLVRGPGDSPFRALGLNPVHFAVTTPFKRAAVDAASIVAPRALRSRSANTLFYRGGALVAETTDGDGVVAGLGSLGVSVEKRTAMVLGTGGAARSAAVGLAQAGATVVLRGRDPDRTRETAEAIGVGWCDPDDIGGAEILVNATVLGTRDDDASPFSEDELISAVAVVDMVYRSAPTPLARQCNDLGTPLLDGRRMLAFQGMAQWAAFNQAPPPREAMLAAVSGSPPHS